MQTQNRAHAGHSHNHDNTYLTSTNKADAGVRITRIGLFVNLGMAIGKGLGGYYFHSQALSADAVHSLTDLVSDFMTLATVAWALKPPTDKFPLGFGKIESLGSLGVSSLLLVGGILMATSSVADLAHLYAPAVADSLEYLGLLGHSHGHSHQIPNMGAAWLAGGSVLIKEWLYRATMKVAKERKSSVLESNAVHHRIDSLTGIAALVSIAVSNIFPAFIGADSVGGLLISWLVISAGWGNTRTALVELADQGIDQEVKDKVQAAATQALGSIQQPGIEVRKVQGIKAGQTYLLELELGVPSDYTLIETGAVEDAVRKRVGEKVRGARRVRVRFVPSDLREDVNQEFISPSVSARSSPEPEDEHDHSHSNGYTHDHQHPNGNGTTKRK
ncbi:Mitochondrial metal transporter 2 [Venturia nashicola]|nr:Mitochondrial metal transporter 2 [Venturia nashicola]